MDDEITFSHLDRLARLNGFQSILVVKSLMAKGKNWKRFYLNGFDCNQSGFITDIGTRWNDYIWRTSLLPGIAPLESRGRTGFRLLSYARDGQHSTLFTSPKALINRIQICPACMKEQTETHGFPWVLRSHCMPGVTVCYRHGLPLQALDVKNGLIQWDNPQKVETKPKALEYATFAAEMLNRSIQTSIFEVAACIREALIDLRQDPRNPEFPSWVDEYTDGRCEIGQILRSRPNGINPMKTLAILLYLFGTVDNLCEHLPSVKHEVDTALLETEGLSLQSDWREDHVTVICNTCGKRFLTSPHLLRTGWGCPQCNASLSDEELFQRLFDKCSKGEWELKSEFISWTKSIEAYSNISKETIYRSADEFINHGKRENQTTKTTKKTREDLNDEVESVGEFKMVNYRRKDSCGIVLTLRHTICGNTFEVWRDKFLKDHRCRCCTPFDSNLRKWKDLTYIKNKRDRTEEKKNVDSVLSSYAKDEIIVEDDIYSAVNEVEYTSRFIHQLVQQGVLKRVFRRCLAFPESEFSEDQIFESLYIHRRGKTFGFPVGDMLMESIGGPKAKSGGTRFLCTIGGAAYSHSIKLFLFNDSYRKLPCPVPINDYNWRILAVLSHFRYRKHCTLDLETQKQLLYGWCKENGFSESDFDQFKPYFNDYVFKLLHQMFAYGRSNAQDAVK